MPLKVLKVFVAPEVWRFQGCKDLVSPKVLGLPPPSIKPLMSIPKPSHPQPHVPMGEVGRVAGDVVAMKSAICRSAHTWDELFPFFICSWIRLSSSSRKDCSTTDKVTTEWVGPLGTSGQGAASLARWKWHRWLGGSLVSGTPLPWWHGSGGTASFVTW